MKRKSKRVSQTSKSKTKATKKKIMPHQRKLMKKMKRNKSQKTLKKKLSYSVKVRLGLQIENKILKSSSKKAR